MIQSLIYRLHQITPLNVTEENFLKKHIPYKIYDKDEFLLRQGDISNAFFFIIKGCVRLFYLNNGQEKTAFFYTENQFVSSYESFVQQVPAKHYLQAIENTQVAVISTQATTQILEHFPKFELLSRILMEEEMIIYQDIIASFVALNPEQRYLKFMRTHAALLQRIPQYHIATYLGVTPETLSRIRKRVAQRKLIDERQ